MGKTLLYLVVLLFLGFGVYYFLFDPKNPFSKDEAGFTIQDTGAIGKIFISGYDGHSVLLQRTDSGWRVNKKYPVLNGTLQNLLVTLHNQKPLYPVPVKMRPHVIQDMAGTSIKVEVYDKDGNKMAVFYVGSEAPNYKGTNMLMADADKPYVVTINGFDGYLTPRYTPYLSDWRGRNIFHAGPDDIKSISVKYPAYPMNSFTIHHVDTTVTVDVDSSLAKYNTMNLRRAKLYLSFFNDVNCEGYVNGAQDLDSILKTMPQICAIDLTRKDGKDNHVDVYWMPINRRSKNLLTSDKNTPDLYDPERYYAVINDYHDTVMIQKQTFEKIFRNGYEFYQPDGQQIVTPDDKHPLKHPIEPYPALIPK